MTRRHSRRHRSSQLAHRKSGARNGAGRLLAIAPWVAVATLTFATSAVAEPNRHVLRQLTNITVGDIETPQLRSQDGSKIAFVATGDVLGIGTSTVDRQIYLWTEATNTTVQVTNGIGCESYDPTRPTDGVFTGSRPEIVAFTSNCNHDPAVGNADGNYEIFFWETESGKFHQITDTVAPADNGDAFVSDSGRCMVFRSSADLDDNNPSNPNYDEGHPGPGFSNPDGSAEVFMMSKISGEGGFPIGYTMTQVSNGPAGTTSEKPVVGGYWFARQCQTTAWQSDHDQFGGTRTGTFVWMYHRPGSEVRAMDYPGEMAESGLIGQFPDGQYTNVHISAASPFARGPHIVFETEPDLWVNDSVGQDVFNFRVFHNRLTQFTDVGTTGITRRPNMSDGGGVVSLDSTGELVNQKRAARIGGEPPFNADGNEEIFRLKGRRKIFQLTRSEDCSNTEATIKDNGRRITFRSTCDLIPGANPSGLPQVFMWSLQKSSDDIMQPGACDDAEGCCKYTRKEAGCYEPIFGTKPKPPRPNCVSKGNCDR